MLGWPTNRTQTNEKSFVIQVRLPIRLVHPSKELISNTKVNNVIEDVPVGISNKYTYDLTRRRMLR